MTHGHLLWQALNSRSLVKFPTYRELAHSVQISYLFSLVRQMKTTKSQIFSCSFMNNSQQWSTKCQLYEGHWYKLKMRDIWGIILSFPNSVLWIYIWSLFKVLTMIFLQFCFRRNGNIMLVLLLGFWNSSSVSMISPQTPLPQTSRIMSGKTAVLLCLFCSGNGGHKSRFQALWITAVRKHRLSSSATSLRTY